MVGAHSAVRAKFAIVAPRPLNAAAARFRARSIVRRGLAWAASTSRLVLSTMQVERELEGTAPGRRRDLADRWFDATRR